MIPRQAIKNTSCPCCSSNNLERFLVRKNVPVYQAVFSKTQKEARSGKVDELDLFVCKGCGFIFNNAFKPNLIKYEANYQTNPLNSIFFSKYIDKLIRYLKNKIKNNGTVVEIGSGGGYFLQKLLTINKSYKGYGFDPCYVGPKIDLRGRLTFIKQYFKSGCLKFPVDLLVCRNVIEHIPNPLDFLKSIKKALCKSPNAYIFFETPSVEWILRNGVIWDFFYEHCSYFTKDSIRTLFENVGFKVKKIHPAFNRQYLWLEAKLNKKTSSVKKNPRRIWELAESFAEEENNLKNEWKRKITELRLKGLVAVLGAGAKGATFVNLIDPDSKLIDCLIDLNANIQGLFVQRTGHPIISYEQAKSRNIKNAILMNPNYLKENIERFKKIGIKLNIHCYNYHNKKIAWSKFQS